MAINSDPDVHNLIICANVFIKDQKSGKYLVLRRADEKHYAPGFIHPVGGKVDPGENPLVAAIREAHEETGLTVENLKLEAIIRELKPVVGEPYDWLVFHFSTQTFTGKVNQTDEGELVWLNYEEIKQEKLFPSVRASIDDILENSNGALVATFGYDDIGGKITTSQIDRLG